MKEYGVEYNFDIILCVMFQLTQDFEQFKQDAEARNRINENLVAKLQDEKKELTTKVAVFEERLNATNSSSEERHHFDLSRLQAVEMDLVAAKLVYEVYDMYANNLVMQVTLSFIKKAVGRFQ